jgi:hypothetical protein
MKNNGNQHVASIALNVMLKVCPFESYTGQCDRILAKHIVLNASIPAVEMREIKHTFAVVHEHVPNGHLYWDYDVAGVN